MIPVSRTHTDNAARDMALDVRERRPSDARPANFYQRFAGNAFSGPHMQLDLDIHWQWSNPLNIFPAFALLLVIIVAVALVAG